MRTTADCRELPSQTACSLTISGSEDEVVLAAAQHAATSHGHEDTPELRRMIRDTLAPDGAAGRYGTVMVATLTGSFDAIQAGAADWVEQRRVDGFLDEEVLLAEDGRTVVATVFFRDRAAYLALADDPDQDAWWSERMAPHLTDVRWIDGTWQQRLTHQPPPALQPA